MTFIEPDLDTNYERGKLAPMQKWMINPKANFTSRKYSDPRDDSYAPVHNAWVDILGRDVVEHALKRIVWTPDGYVSGRKDNSDIIITRLIAQTA